MHSAGYAHRSVNADHNTGTFFAAPDAAQELEGCCLALDSKAKAAVVSQLQDVESGTCVDLSRSYVGSVGLQAISVVLPSNLNLTEVRAPRNGLTNEVVILFCRAMIGHPRLAMLDFSDNLGLSLMGGTALLSLVQANPALRHIYLTGCSVPEAVLRKLGKALEKNKGRAPNSNEKPICPMPSGVPSSLLSARGATFVSTPSSREEEKLLTALRAKAQTTVQEGFRLPPAAPVTGWRVLEVPILAAPLLFESEVDLLCSQVFPQLNRSFAHHKVLLRPVLVLDDDVHLALDSATGTVSLKREDVGSTKVHRSLASYGRDARFISATDVRAAVEGGRFVAIELIGDRPGDYAQLSDASMAQLSLDRNTRVNTLVDHAAHRIFAARVDDTQPTSAAPNGDQLQPILYDAHETATHAAQWVLLATRQKAAAMQAPAAVAPFLTCDPAIAFMDRHRPMLLNVVEESSKVERMSGKLPWSYDDASQQWDRHVMWRRKVTAAAPVQELVLRNYGATFECMDAKGTMRLGGLQAFGEALYKRLHTLLDVCVSMQWDTAVSEEAGTTQRAVSVSGYAAAAASSVALQASLQRSSREVLLQLIAATGSSETAERLLDRLMVYVAKPAAEKLLLVHADSTVELTAALIEATYSLQRPPYNYRVACSTPHTALVREEPTDVRSVVVDLVNQLTTNAAVLLYVRAEVDVERLCAFFAGLLAGVKMKSGHVVPPQQDPTESIMDALPDTMAAIYAAGLSKELGEYVLGTPVDKGGVLKRAQSTLSRTGYVVVVDRAEQLDALVQPCGALVRAPGNAKATARVNKLEPAHWTTPSGTPAPTVARRRSQARPSVHQLNASRFLESLPNTMLANNVHVVMTCMTGSPYFDGLANLLERPVDVVALNSLDAHAGSASVISMDFFARHGVACQEEDVRCARAKADAMHHEYVNYLLAAVQQGQRGPTCAAPSQVIQDFPETLTGAAQRVYNTLAISFGLPLTRQVLGLLTASRWGLTTVELCDLLPLVSSRRLQHLLHVLQPVLEHAASPQASSLLGRRSGNALLGKLRICSPAFLNVSQQAARELVWDVEQLDADEQVWHTQLARYYLGIAAHTLGFQVRGAGDRTRDDAPSTNVSYTFAPAAPSSNDTPPAVLCVCRQAMKECVHHVPKSGALWTQLDAVVLSVPFLMTVYGLDLGYAFLRDLTTAFNERYRCHLLGEEVTSSAQQGNGRRAAPGSARDGLPPVLSRMRDYVRFAHDHGLHLSLCPSLVIQLALQIPTAAGDAVRRDVEAYLIRAEPSTDLLPALSWRRKPMKDADHSAPVYFTEANHGPDASIIKSIHLGPITAAIFLPNRKFVVTASRDRSINWVYPDTGAVAWTARQPKAAVESLTVSQSSAYLAAVSADRSLWIYDGVRGAKLLVHCRGADWFDAPIAAATFSARGRYLWVVTTDTHLRCFESETGRLRCSMGLPQLMRQFALGAVASTKGAAGRANKPYLYNPRKEEEQQRHALPAWHHHRTHLHVVPALDEDEDFSTVLGQEVRHWHLQPWVATSAHEEENRVTPEAKKTAVMIAELRRQDVVRDSAPASLGGDLSSKVAPQGYKLLQPWQSTAGQTTIHAACCVAVPARETSEMHLIVLEETEGIRDRTSLAVLCLLAPQIDGADEEQKDKEEITIFAASVDGRWMAAGLASGRVAIFDVGARFESWCTKLSPSSAETAMQKMASKPPLPRICRPSSFCSGLQNMPGCAAVPIHALIFGCGNEVLFGLGRTLQCWRTTAMAKAKNGEEVPEAGEYTWPQPPTCLAVLPPAISSATDVQLTSAMAELCVGAEDGRLTMLIEWRKPTT